MIRVSASVDLLVIKIERPMILCARNTPRSREQRKKHRAASTCERFVYSTVKIARFYDYQKWPTYFLEKFVRYAKVCGLLFS